jgi:iron(III) transport system substrate-binding protein
MKDKRNAYMLSGILAGIISVIAITTAVAAEPPRKVMEVWPYLAKLDPEERLAVLEREAAREGGAVLYGATGIDRANFWIGEFNKRYPNISIEFVRLKAPELVEKVLSERRAGRSQSDLIITTITYLDIVKEALAPYKTSHWDDFASTFRYGGDSDGWYAVVYEIFPHSIGWRTDRVSSADAPRSLKDLSKAMWKGRIGTTTHLEDFLNSLEIVYGKKKALSVAERLATQENRLYRSHSALADGLAAGEVDVAWEIVAARPINLKKKGAPVDWAFGDPLFAEGNTISVNGDTQHPYTAALFVEVMLDAPTLEASDKWQSGRIFGNAKGSYEFSLHDNKPELIQPAISPERYRELNRIAEEMFIRR